jgi:hypothetical protein
MGILFIYLYNGAARHARADKAAFTLFGGAFCAEMCQRLRLNQERRCSLPACVSNPQWLFCLSFKLLYRRYESTTNSNSPGVFQSNKVESTHMCL